MLEFSAPGDFFNLKRFLKKPIKPEIERILNTMGRQGVAALSAATPVHSGLTAASWNYEVDSGGGNLTVTWFNTHVNDGVNIAIILQYGHGTGTGGYVSGRDYINPAILPIFDKIVEDGWKAVQSL